MAMMSTSELEWRLDRARTHQEEEPGFFRCLLDAIVYAHVPLSDDHPRVRLIQFWHPDGFLAVPFFTSEAKARFAGGSTVRTVKLTGRELLAATPGATFMLNPNDGGCVLYPEEIESLLRTGTVARVETTHLENDLPFLISEQFDAPAWLVPCLVGLYARLPYVQSAYLLEVAAPQAPDNRSLLIALGVAPAHAERAARATITSIQPLCARSDLALDITTYDPLSRLPPYLCQPGAQRIHEATQS